MGDWRDCEWGEETGSGGERLREAGETERGGEGLGEVGRD